MLWYKVICFEEKSSLLYLRHVELVVLVEELSDNVYLQEFGTTTSTNVATKIGYLVGQIEVTLLAQHANSSKEELLRCDVLLLQYGNNAIREVQQALQLVVIADGKHGIGTTEGCKVASRVACI